MMNCESAVFLLYLQILLSIVFERAEGIRGMMGEKGLKEEDWTDRSNWRLNGRSKMWKHCTTC
jgi:hypothetical protein